ncbi:hypothetical protein MED193_00665 [Roseobacter sp. MED193]|uniref:AAA domain-containing protein n=1 Tax=Roseobacter sp. MED193 TaxID=314262 RepID=UPI000068A044|nr:AAA domain-containing protein [Roseobacter sp. MED193]EAQ44005.1 hypothetical protein MED193_00665 [Roseobacter sp. MED193]
MTRPEQKKLIAAVQSLQAWQAHIQDRGSLRLQVSLSCLLRSRYRPFSISVREFQKQVSNGVLLRRDDTAPDEAVDTSAQPTRAHFRLVTNQHAFSVTSALDPIDGMGMLHARDYLWTRKPITFGMAVSAAPIKVAPIITLHLLPWTRLPTDWQDWVRSLETEGLLVPFNPKTKELDTGSRHVWHSGPFVFEVQLLAAEGEEPANAVVNWVGRRKNGKNLPSRGSKAVLHLDADSLRLETSLPLVLPPTLLGSNVFPRTRSPRHFKSLGLDKARDLRRPEETEIEDLSPLPEDTRFSNDDIAPLMQNGVVALDFATGRNRFSLFARPTVSPLTGRPYLAVVGAKRTPKKTGTGHRNAETATLRNDCLRPVSAFALELKKPALERLWKGAAPPPTPQAVFSDLDHGFNLLNFASEPVDGGGIKLNSTQFYLIVRPEQGQPREPIPGVRVHIATHIQPNDWPLRVCFQADLIPVNRIEPLFPDELLIERSNDSTRRTLDAHYHFSSHFAQLLNIRDAGTFHYSPRPSWRAPVNVLGVQDRTRRVFPNVPERIAQVLGSVRPRVLLRLNAPPGRGLFLDGSAVGLVDDQGNVSPFRIEVISGQHVLLRAVRRPVGPDKEPPIDQYECPFSPGDKAWIFRRHAVDRADLEQQIRDLRAGKYFVASQEVFARVVSQPDALSGAFEPNAPVEQLMARNTRKRACANPLNARQKEAVSKAARTPHAFFIKGPPGTGKTEVIRELVEILAARGERILLTSAQNKPLADATERCMNSYGVVPTRITGRRPDLNPSEASCLWASLVERLTAAFDKDDGFGDRLDAEEHRLHALWQSRIALGGLDAAARDARIEDLVRQLLSSVNLYVINIDALAGRIGSLRARLERATAGPRPDDEPDGGPIHAGITSVAATQSARNSPTITPDFEAEFDTLIIDEASRVNDSAFVTAALRCRRWILVGDERQLPPFLADTDASFFHALCALYLVEGRMIGALAQKGIQKHQVPTLDAYLTDTATSDTELRDAVERVGNLWLMKDDRRPIQSDQVQDIAAALLWQGAFAGRTATANPEEEDAQPRQSTIGKKFDKIIQGQARHHAQPRRPSLQAPQTEWQAYQDMLASYFDAVIDGVQNNFDKFFVRSFFERGYATGNTTEDDNGQAEGFRATLVEQFRMVPEIANLVSERVYDGEYVTPETPPVCPLHLPSFPHQVHFVDLSLLGRISPATQIGTSWANPDEAEHVIEIIRKISAELPGGTTVSVMVLSLFAAQTEFIRARATEVFGSSGAAPALKGISRLDFGNVDAVQGGEADIVVMSFVRVATGGMPEPGMALFLQDMRRLNVAITRARRKIIFVGHGTTIENLSGTAKAADFLAWMASAESGTVRDMPLRLPYEQLVAGRRALRRFAGSDRTLAQDAEADGIPDEEAADE